MEFHPSKIPISKTFDVKDEKQATEAAHEMVMSGFDKEGKGYKVLMSKENEKTAKRIGYTVTTTVTYALRKTNQERDVRYWTYHEDKDKYAIVFVSSKVLEKLDFSW
jgi:RNase P protein component